MGYLDIIVIYLMVGVLFNLIIDFLCDAFETQNQLTILDRAVVGVLWPWSIIKLILEFRKAKK